MVAQLRSQCCRAEVDASTADPPQKGCHVLYIVLLMLAEVDQTCRFLHVAEEEDLEAETRTNDSGISYHVSVGFFRPYHEHKLPFDDLTLGLL